MALSDVEKAFDNFWHDGLIHNLHLFGFYMYCNCCNCLLGVLQGSILAQILYNIFTHDLPTLPSNGVLFFFVDDTAVIYKDKITRYLVRCLQRSPDVLSIISTTAKLV